MTSPATVLQDGKRLILSGALLRDEVTDLHRQLQSISGAEIDVIDLQNVSEIDSAGLALLSKWTDQNFRSKARPALLGQPSGLAELRAAYRLTSLLEFAQPK